MSKRTVAILFALLLGVVAKAQFADRCPEQDPPPSRSSSSAFGSAFVSGTGPVQLDAQVVGDASATLQGSSSGPSGAGSQCTLTVDSSPSDFSQAVDVCFNTNQPPSATVCRNVNIQDDAACLSDAAAATFGFVSAECSPGGVACGAVATDSDEISCRVGRAIREVAEQVGTFGDPICEESIVAVIDAVRSESATLRDTVCSPPETPSSTLNADFTAAVQDDVAGAFAACWTYCDGFGL